MYTHVIPCIMYLAESGRVTGDTILGRHYAGIGPHIIMSGVGFETKPPLEVKGSCMFVYVPSNLETHCELGHSKH